MKEAVTDSKIDKEYWVLSLVGAGESTFILFDRELHQHPISLKALDGLSEKPLNLTQKSWLLV